MQEKIYDAIIIGGGPAGLSAGIYAGRAKLDVLVIEKEEKGGQIKLTSEVVNYPGVLETSGTALVETIKEQAKNFGVEFTQDEVVSVNFDEKIKTVKTKNGEYKALSVIIATGASPRRLNFPGESDYMGKGIGFCATCDGEFFTGLDIVVVGAGFAAAEEAIFLTKYAKKVYVIAREPEFTCAQSIADKVLANPKIEVKFNTEIVEATGDNFLRKLKLKNNITNEETEYSPENNETFGLFIFVGYEPQSKTFKGHVELDEQGYIVTDQETLTNKEGVYAVGDIRPKKLKQVVTAVADGAIAATNIERYVFELREKLGLKKEEKKSQSENSSKNEKSLDESIMTQLKQVANLFENNIELAVIKSEDDEKNNSYINLMNEIGEASDKITVKVYDENSEELKEKNIEIKNLPAIVILNNKGEYSRISYSTLPMGHELNSFILAMYNVAGPGQKISEDLTEKIKKLDKKLNVKVGISLNCTRCPDTVQATQRIAAENKNVEIEVIDVFSHTDFKTKYGLLSVPAMVINDDILKFGQMNLEEMIEILEKI